MSANEREPVDCVVERMSEGERGGEREGESIVGKYLWRLSECRSRHEGCFLEASLPQPIRA